MSESMAHGSSTAAARPWWRRAPSLPALCWDSLQRLRRLLWRRRLVALAALALLFLVWLGMSIGFSSIHSATVLVVHRPAVGIPPPVESLDFGDVPPGGGITRMMTLENNSPIPLRVTVFAVGGIRPFIDIDDAFFRLDPGEEHVVTMKATAPNSAKDKRYNGRVVVVQMPWFPW